MNTRKNLIVANGKIITPDIASIKYNLDTTKYEIRFKNDKTYFYNYSNIIWLKSPEVLSPNFYTIKHLNKELFNIDAIYVFKGDNDEYWHVRFDDGTERDYLGSNLDVVESCLADKTAKNVFEYLKDVAHLVSLKTEDGFRLLSHQYNKISEKQPNSTALSAYLNPHRFIPSVMKSDCLIFPFGCNASQFQGVKNALENQLSVIQGPPGTGKTQTILNIIVNLLLNEKTVQVVSSSNSATTNVLEKMQSEKYGLDFLAAVLGSETNKELFQANQSEKYPDLSAWSHSNIDEEQLKSELIQCQKRLETIYQTQVNRARLYHELQSIETEQKHFEQYKLNTKFSTFDLNIKRVKKSEKAIFLLQKINSAIEKQKKYYWGLKAQLVLLFGSKVLNCSLSDLVDVFQDTFYRLKIQELNERIDECNQFLEENNSDNLAYELEEKSLVLLQKSLFQRYGCKKKRTEYSLFDGENFTRDYPVILSTTYSSRNSFSNYYFDYVIIDESSQVDIATGTLAISSAYNAVIVGDSKQLPNVVSTDIKKRSDALFKKYNLSDKYSFSDNSFLDSLLALLPKTPQVLLHEHYRCAPKIIGFCNQKFYDNKLVVMTDDDGDNSSLHLVKTVKGNHERERFNQRQIDVIIEEILPNIQAEPEEIGIIAPYNNQVKALKNTINNSKIDVSTVHKFQGREKDVIIISTVDDEITEFVDDPNLLNVAVSRAKKQLFIVTNGNETKSSNVNDLISYIEYNNCSVSNSKIYSIFDYLYSQCTYERIEFLKNHKRISKYDSENIMHALICNVLKEEEFSQFGVLCHYPTNMLIRDTSLLNEKEKEFVSSKGAHTDFLIYSTITKKPKLAIEVDGYNFHKKGTKQSERDEIKDEIFKKYNIPLLRLSTIGSNEENKIKDQLRKLN